MKKTPSKNLTVHEGITHALGHDIKQPLGLIRAYSYYVQKMLPKAEGGLSRYTEKINFQVDLLASMLDNVVESIKLENDQVTYKEEPVELSELLESIITELQAIYPEVPFKTELDPSLKIIRGDTLYLRLAFRNVIDNAARFSDKSVPVTIQGIRKADAVIINCSNSGSAIPDEEVQLVTRPYYKAQNATDGSTKGLGIGLYIAHKIVLHHKGSLTIKSSSTQTKTTVLLPAG